MCVSVLSMCWCMCVQHVMHGDAAWDAWGVLSVCMAWHWGTNWTYCVNTTNTDQNMISMISQDKIQALELTWVQFNTKMSLGHFVKHLTCNKVYKWWKMYEYNENCHKGPTQRHKQQIGLSPNKDFEKFSQKLRTLTYFWKIPNIQNPKLKST